MGTTEEVKGWGWPRSVLAGWEQGNKPAQAHADTDIDSQSRAPYSTHVLCLPLRQHQCA